MAQKSAYRGGAVPARGDVILPGETTEVRDNRILIGGVAQPTTPAPDGAFVDDSCRSQPMRAFTEVLGDTTHVIYTNPGHEGILANSPPLRVPDDGVFVMGDNRDNASDSRRWGAVPLDHVKGRATRVWLSSDPCKGGVRSERHGLAL